MEVLSQSPVTERSGYQESATTCADNGPLKANEAGSDNTSGRAVYRSDIDTITESHSTIVSNRNVIKRNIRSFISQENRGLDIACRYINNAGKGITSLPDTLKSTTRQGENNIVNSTGKASTRRTTLISKTKFHYVKMIGDQCGQESLLVEEVYPGFMNKSKSSESIAMDSEDSYCSSQSSGIYDKRLSIVSALSHSDYETCGSLTSLDEFESDGLSVCSSGVRDDNVSNIPNKYSQADGQSSRPQSSVLGDSELEESDFTSETEEATKQDEGRVRGTNIPKRERPAILDQGMAATMAWLRGELMEIRKMDQDLIGQFMNIQGKIRTLKTQQQQRRKHSMATRKQSLAGENGSELLGNHRFSWELDSLYEEDEYYDYDTDDDSDDQDGGESCLLGACGYS